MTPLIRKEFTFRVISGGPVAKASVVMAAISDGPSYNVDGGATERGPGPIPANKINFFPTNDGDVIELTLRTN